MEDHLLPEEQMLRSALQPGPECPSVVQLERLLDHASTSPELPLHVESCTYCQNELHMLKEFRSGAIRASEAQAVRRITAQLQARSGNILKRRQPRDRESWWRALWTTPWLAPAGLAVAGLLIAVGINLQYRGAPPIVHTPGAGDEVLRSNAVSVTAPVGDVQQAPSDVEWLPAANAARYEVRLLEVDGTELWRAESAGVRIAFP